MKKYSQFFDKNALLSIGIALLIVAVFGVAKGTYAYFSDQQTTSKAQLTLKSGVVKLDDIADVIGDGATGDNQFKLGEFDWTYLGNDSKTDGSTPARTTMKDIKLPFNNVQISPKVAQSFSHTLPGDVFRKIIRVGYGSTTGAVAAKYSINWVNMPNASGPDSDFTNVDVQIIAGVGNQQDLTDKKPVKVVYSAKGALDDFGTTSSHTGHNTPLTGNVDAKQYIEIAIYVGIRRDIQSGKTETEIFKNLTKQLKVTVEQRLETRSDTSNLAVKE
ncbi:SipW-dependent-type signal peptide-containing protein [Enterococcus cecorum]